MNFQVCENLSLRLTGGPFLPVRKIAAFVFASLSVIFLSVGNYALAAPGWGGVVFVLCEAKEPDELPPPLNDGSWDYVCVVGAIVEESKAKSAGLKGGDIVFRCGGLIKTKDDFEEMKNKEIESGDVITLSIKRRDDKKISGWSTKTIRFKAISANVKKKYEDELADAKKKIEQDYKASKCPIEVSHGVIKKNLIDTPVIHFGIENKSTEKILGIEFKVRCLNSFNEQDGKDVTEVFQTPIDPGRVTMAEIPLHLNRETTKAIFVVTRIKLASGQTWTQTAEDAKKYNRVHAAATPDEIDALSRKSK